MGSEQGRQERATPREARLVPRALVPDAPPRGTVQRCRRGLQRVHRERARQSIGAVWLVAGVGHAWACSGGNIKKQDCRDGDASSDALRRVCCVLCPRFRSGCWLLEAGHGQDARTMVARDQLPQQQRPFVVKMTDAQTISDYFRLDMTPSVCRVSPAPRPSPIRVELCFRLRWGNLRCPRRCWPSEFGGHSIELRAV